MGQAGRHRRTEPSKVPEEAGAAPDGGQEGGGPEGGGTTELRPTPHTLALIAVPAAVVGIGSSLLLLLVSYLAGQIEHFLWNWLPHAAGTTGSAWYWILGILTMTGVAVGLVVRYVPGHAGPDPATLGLVEPPMALAILPSLLLAPVLALARRGEPRPGEPDHRREHRAGLRARRPLRDPGAGAGVGGARGRRQRWRAVRYAGGGGADPVRVRASAGPPRCGTACSDRWSRPGPDR